MKTYTPDLPMTPVLVWLHLLEYHHTDQEYQSSGTVHTSRRSRSRSFEVPTRTRPWCTPKQIILQLVH